MIFDKEKWPVLYALQNNIGFFDMATRGVIHNPYDFMDHFAGFQAFLEQFVGMRNCGNMYITEKIRQMVDYHPKIYPVLERESRKPEFWPEFHGTISYVVIEGNDRLKMTVLLDIIPREEFNGKKYFMISVFAGELFVGYFAAEDLGDRVDVLQSLPGPVGKFPDQIKAIMDTFTFCKQLLFFLDHCDEKTKYILTDSVRRVKTANGDKFINPMKLSNMQIIDSSYFTTTIRTGEFPVSGHWRMQAYGQARQNRKLVWIKDFVKFGYTRKSVITGEEGHGEE